MLTDRQPPSGALDPTTQQTLPELAQSAFAVHSSMPPPEHAVPISQAVSLVVVSRQQTSPVPQVLGRHSPPDALELDAELVLMELALDAD